MSKISFKFPRGQLVKIYVCMEVCFSHGINYFSQVPLYHHPIQRAIAFNSVMIRVEHNDYKWLVLQTLVSLLHTNINQLVQERRNSSVLPMELPLSCINPSIYIYIYYWIMQYSILISVKTLQRRPLWMFPSLVSLVADFPLILHDRYHLRCHMQ